MTPKKSDVYSADAENSKTRYSGGHNTDKSMLDLIDHSSFHPLQREDFPQVNEWLHQPHVAKWWYPDVLSWDQFVEKYEELLASDSCHGYIVWVDETPIGYISEYDANREPDPNGNLDPKGTFGFDVYIGEPRYLGKGYGTAICQKFVKHLIVNRHATRLIIDPRAAFSMEPYHFFF